MGREGTEVECVECGHEEFIAFDDMAYGHVKRGGVIPLDCPRCDDRTNHREKRR